MYGLPEEVYAEANGSRSLKNTLGVVDNQLSGPCRTVDEATTRASRRLWWNDGDAFEASKAS